MRMVRVWYRQGEGNALSPAYYTATGWAWFDGVLRLTAAGNTPLAEYTAPTVGLVEFIDVPDEQHEPTPSAEPGSSVPAGV